MREEQNKFIYFLFRTEGVPLSCAKNFLKVTNKWAHYKIKACFYFYCRTKVTSFRLPPRLLPAMMTTITHPGLREFLKEGTLIRILRLFCTKKSDPAKGRLQFWWLIFRNPFSPFWAIRDYYAVYVYSTP